ncbi:Protein translocase subunit SecA [Diplonema papillatum]|nr:Protein translocase subunit SecA [Diplonema papillatum]
MAEPCERTLTDPARNSCEPDSGDVDGDMVTVAGDEPAPARKGKAAGAGMSVGEEREEPICKTASGKKRRRGDGESAGADNEGKEAKLSTLMPTADQATIRPAGARSNGSSGLFGPPDLGSFTGPEQLHASLPREEVTEDCSGEALAGRTGTYGAIAKVPRIRLADIKKARDGDVTASVPAVDELQAVDPCTPAVDQPQALNPRTTSGTFWDPEPSHIVGPTEESQLSQNAVSEHGGERDKSNSCSGKASPNVPCVRFGDAAGPAAGGAANAAQVAAKSEARPPPSAVDPSPGSGGVPCFVDRAKLPVPGEHAAAWEAFSAMPPYSTKWLTLLLLHFSVDGGLVADVQPVCSELEKCLVAEGKATPESRKCVATAAGSGAKAGRNAVQTLVTRCRPLDVPALLRQLRSGVDTANVIRDRDVVLLLGSTGAGKSTLLHWIGGTKFRQVEENGRVHLQPHAVPASLTSCTLSSRGRSETRLLTAADFLDTCWCDAPGFDDTDLLTEVANGCAVARAFSRARTVYPVLVFSRESVGDRGHGFVTLMDNLQQFIPRLDEVVSSLTYVFTKFSDEELAKLPELLDDKLACLISDDNVHVDLLQNMYDQCTEDMFVIRPLQEDARQPQDLLDIIKRKTPLPAPGLFKGYVAPAAGAKFTQQIEIMVADHAFAVGSNRFDLAVYLQTSIRELADLVTATALSHTVTKALQNVEKHASDACIQLLDELQNGLALSAHNQAAVAATVPLCVSSLEQLSAFPKEADSITSPYARGLQIVKRTLHELVSVCYTPTSGASGATPRGGLTGSGTATGAQPGANRRTLASAGQASPFVEVPATPRTQQLARKPAGDLTVAELARVDTRRSAARLATAEVIAKAFAKHADADLHEIMSGGKAYLDALTQRSTELVLDLISARRYEEAAATARACRLNDRRYRGLQNDAQAWLTAARTQMVSTLGGCAAAVSVILHGNAFFKRMDPLRALLPEEFVTREHAEIDAAFVDFSVTQTTTLTRELLPEGRYAEVNEVGTLLDLVLQEVHNPANREKIEKLISLTRMATDQALAENLQTVRAGLDMLQQSLRDSHSDRPMEINAPVDYNGVDAASRHLDAAVASGVTTPADATRIETCRLQMAEFKARLEAEAAARAETAETEFVQDFAHVSVVLVHATGMKLASAKPLAHSIGRVTQALLRQLHDASCPCTPAQLQQAMLATLPADYSGKDVDTAARLREIIDKTTAWLHAESTALVEVQDSLKDAIQRKETIHRVVKLLGYWLALKTTCPAGVPVFERLQQFADDWRRLLTERMKTCRAQLGVCTSGELGGAHALLEEVKDLIGTDALGPFGDDREAFFESLYTRTYDAMKGMGLSLVNSLRVTAENFLIAQFDDAYKKVEQSYPDHQDQARSLAREFAASIERKLASVDDQLRQIPGVLNEKTTADAESCITVVDQFTSIHAATFLSGTNLSAQHERVADTIRDRADDFTAKAEAAHQSKKACVRQLRFCRKLAKKVEATGFWGPASPHPQFAHRFAAGIDRQLEAIQTQCKTEADKVAKLSLTEYHVLRPRSVLADLRSLIEEDRFFEELHEKVCSQLLSSVTGMLKEYEVKVPEEDTLAAIKELRNALPDDVYKKVERNVQAIEKRARDDDAQRQHTAVEAKKLRDPTRLIERALACGSYGWSLDVFLFMREEDAFLRLRLDEHKLPFVLESAPRLFDHWQYFLDHVSDFRLLRLRARESQTQLNALADRLRTCIVCALERLSSPPFRLAVLEETWKVVLKLQCAGPLLILADECREKAFASILKNLSWTRFDDAYAAGDYGTVCCILDELQAFPSLIAQLQDTPKDVVPHTIRTGLQKIMTHASVKDRLRVLLMEAADTAKAQLWHHKRLHATEDARSQRLFLDGVSDALTNLHSMRLWARHLDRDVDRLCEEVCESVLNHLSNTAGEAWKIIADRKPWSNAAEEDHWSRELDSTCSVLRLAAKILRPEHSSLQQNAEHLMQSTLQELRDALDTEFPTRKPRDVSVLATWLIHTKAFVEAAPTVKEVAQAKINAILKETERRKGAVRELSVRLRSVTDEGLKVYADMLINDHKAFADVSTALRNEKTLRVNVEQVAARMAADSANTAFDRELLTKWYTVFETGYWDVLEKQLPLGLEVTKNQLVREAQEHGKYARGDPSPEALVPVIVRLFAYWTILHSSSILLGQEDYDDHRANVMQPHSAQVLSIFRLLGFDCGLSNHFAEIGTGEGKSVTIAIVALVVALMGHQADCICYSEYLSSRDAADFAEMFRAFGVADRVRYGTLNKQCERLINSQGDVRTLVLSLMTNTQPTSHTADQHAVGTKRFALIDEVDVFLRKEFYGEEYCVHAPVRHPTVSSLAEHVWEQHVASPGAVKPSAILRSPQCAACCASLGSLWQPLVERAVIGMVQALATFGSTAYVVDTAQDKIGYTGREHGVDFSISYGYKTMWAYFDEHDKRRITKESRDARVALIFDCGSFSYAEIPKKYDVIFGLTGTLKTLSSGEKSLLHDVYDINTFSYMPSVYGANNSLVFDCDTAQAVVLCDPWDHIVCILNEIKVCADKKRPVIVFFESNAPLTAFIVSSEYRRTSFEGCRVNVLTEEVDDSCKESFIRTAATLGTITLTVGVFSRGTDFKCFDDRVNLLGGVHVIQTYVSDNLSDERQVQGRTARQGDKGSFGMVLDKKALERFSIRDGDVQDMQRCGERYTAINAKRCNAFEKQYQECMRQAEAVRGMHEEGMRFLGHLSERSVLPALEFLLSRNHAVASTGVVRYVVLMDATGSMGALLSKAKNTVQQMHARVHEILAEKGSASLVVELQFAVYRNYDCPFEQLLAFSPWESSPEGLRDFMATVRATGGTTVPEAIEVALWHANNMVDEYDAAGFILIGDAPANSFSEVIEKRAARGEDYWRTTPLAVPADFSEQLQSLDVPVHAFHVYEHPLTRACFERIADATGGWKGYLDIDSDKGAALLTELVSTTVLDGIGGSDFVSAYHEKYGHLVELDA